MKAEGPSRGFSAAKKAVSAAELRRRFGGRPVTAALIADLALLALLWPGHATRVLSTLLLLPALAVAAVETRDRAAAAAVGSVLCVLVVDVAIGFGAGNAGLVRLAVVAGGAALGVGGAELREQTVLAHRHLQLLGEVAGIASGGAAVEVSMARVAALIAPAFADLCEIVPLGAGDGDGLTDVLLDLGGPQSDADARRLQALGMRSAILVSVAARGTTLARMTMAVGRSRGRFRARDLIFARTLASRAGLAVDNARLMAEAAESRRQMEAVVGPLAEAVTIRSLDGRLVYANQAALESMNLSSQDELLSRSTRSLMADHIVSDEHGDPLGVDALPSVRLLRGEEPKPLLMRVIDRSDGRETWRMLKAAPLTGADGALEAAVTIIEDVTDAKRAELRTRFLSRVSETLAESLETDVTLDRLAWSAVPELADWCAVDLLDERGQRRRLSVAHRDPARIELARTLLGNTRIDPSTPLGRVLRTGVPVLLTEISPEMLRAGAGSERRLAVLRALGPRSVIVVPMRAADRVIGAITLVSSESGRRFNAEDMAFAEQIAARAAVAVENARLASSRREIARVLQRSLLPDRLPELQNWLAAAMYTPSDEAEEVEVGGDFYDLLPGPSGCLVVLGDVTGKGVEAAALTSLLRHGARFLSLERRDPAQILTAINDALLDAPELSLCTMLCLRLEHLSVAGASAGHPAPIVLRDDGRVREIGLAGPLLGAWKQAAWKTRSFSVAPDETLLLYTDGVVEAQGQDERFGAERLRALLRDHAGASPPELLAALERELQVFSSGASSDDAAALALRPRRDGSRGSALEQDE